MLRLLVPLILTTSLLLAEARQGDLQLTLPPMCFAVPGVPLSIYHDNIVLTQQPEALRFEFKCDVGTSEARRWTVLPADGDVGDHPITVTVRDAGGKAVQSGKTVLRVVPKNAGADRSLRLLIIGDSLTNATAYPNEIARLLSEPGNPKWTMLGTHKPASVKPGVAHEGYGGWKWVDFLSKFDPKPAADTAGPPARKSTSPFIFADASNQPVLDIPRYFKEHCGGQPPDVATFLLGINDCFAARPDDPKLMDAKIDEVLGNAEKFLAAFRKAAPKTILAIGLTTPPNSRQAAFEANYQDKYTRWGWKRIQHRLVQRMLEQFSNRTKDNIFLVPTELNVDPIDGYPENNGVHPNTTGYNQIAASFYSWLKAWMAAGR